MGRETGRRGTLTAEALWIAALVTEVTHVTTFTATSKAADAPELEPGMYDAVFTGTEAKTVKGGKWQKNEAGDPKLEWNFNLIDEDGNKLSYETSDGEDKPLVVSKLTGVGFNVASSTVPQEIRVLKALLTAAEFAAFEAGEGTDEKLLLGRKVQVEVFVKEGGWPGVANVLPAKKAPGKVGAKPKASAPEPVDE